MSSGIPLHDIYTIPQNTCLCGKSFVQTNAFNNHLRSCKISQKRVSFGRAKAEELWREKKQQRCGIRMTRAEEPVQMLPDRLVSHQSSS